jgi:cytochrome c-type biogenesis protein CcmH
MRKLYVFLLIDAILIAAFILYFLLGNSEGVRNAVLLEQFNTAAAEGDTNPIYLQNLIKGLNKQLDKHPDDPITLALLAKIYFTQGDYALASSTFAKAYQLLPDDPEVLIDYTSAYYLAHDGKSDVLLESLLTKVKKLEPTLASLSLLANVALDRGDTVQAIAYWREMQAQLPKDSELYLELEEMIQLVSD